jgi:hypothetical protein
MIADSNKAREKSWNEAENIKKPQQACAIGRRLSQRNRARSGIAKPGVDWWRAKQIAATANRLAGCRAIGQSVGVFFVAGRPFSPCFVRFALRC